MSPIDRTGSRLITFPTKYVPGWDGVKDPAKLPRGNVEALHAALLRKYPTDAHFALYSHAHDDAPMRINKSALYHFQVHDPENMPFLEVVAIDVDSPGHEHIPWDDMATASPNQRSWLANVQTAIGCTPELKHAGVYLTRAGMRFIWPAGLPITLPYAKSYLTQFLDYLIAQGLPADRLADPTRVYRLPRVIRDGVFQDYQISLDAMQPLVWTAPDPLTNEDISRNGTAATTLMPNTLPTLKVADLAEFKTHWFYPHLRNGLPLAPVGERHNVIRGVIGTIVETKQTNDPQIPYLLLQNTLDAQGANKTVHAEVWQMCVWVCCAHDGQMKAKADETTDALKRQAESMECAPERVTQRLILYTKINANYYVWDENLARYRSSASNQTQLLPLLATYCPQLSGAEYLPANTGAPELLREFGTPVDSVVISYTARKTYHDPTTATVYEQTLKWDGNLRPKYNADVDRWMRALFGNEVERCMDWVAAYPRFDQATCALYIDGPPGIGKGLLTAGLSRITQSTPAPYNVLNGNFNEELCQSPLVIADEKVPEEPFKESGSSILRRTIGTGNIKINRKHKPPAELAGHPRVLITANNANALQLNEALDETDIAAIQERIGYVRTTDAARIVLRELAQDAPVYELTQMWVAGGQLAQHVLWLRDNRQITPGDRFLVPGWKSPLTLNMAVQFGAAPTLAKFIVRAIRDKIRLQGLHWGNGKIVINVDYIRANWQRVTTDADPGDTKLNAAAQVLSKGVKHHARPTETEMERLYWEISAEYLVVIAETQHITTADALQTAINAPPENATQTLQNILDTHNNTQ